MRRDEWLAGAPILRGRWGAIAALWWAGYLMGRTQPVGDLIYGTYHGWRDWISLGLGMAMLVLGVLLLDQYGRNAWLTWAPDDTRWDGRFTRTEVNRRPGCPGKTRSPRP